VTKRNAAAVIVEDFPFDTPAGHLRYTRTDGKVVGILFGCPCGCGARYGAVFEEPQPWTFDGNIEKPTVNPSLGCYPTGKKAANFGPDGVYHWHGFLRAGVFEEC
jgi:hypothetical protein